MKEFYRDLGTACIMGLLVPTLVLMLLSELPKPQVQLSPPEPFAPPQTLPQPEPEKPQKMLDILMNDGTVKTMAMNDYLTGVVLAEMPAGFSEEAHKAQAVVARTYTLRAQERGGRHENAAVCTDHTCCQAYVSEGDYLSRGGTQEDIEKIRSIVEQTDGYILTYDGELIEATYFSCSGGWTEDAVAVWGTDVPYLRSTVSPGEENAAHYSDTVTFSPKQFAEALGLENDGNPKGWFSDIRYTAGGGVESMSVQGEVFPGTVLRKLLELRSTAFSIQAEEDAITVTTRGYGHRVGMSQYGANAMAMEGKQFPEILAHYYAGTVLEMRTD